MPEKIPQPQQEPLNEVFYVDGEPRIIFRTDGKTYTFMKERGTLEVICTGVRGEEGLLLQENPSEDLWNSAREKLASVEIDPQ